MSEVYKVYTNGLYLRYVNPYIEDYDVVCAVAVHQNGLALQYVIEECMINYDDVCAFAVEQNGLALKHVNAIHIPGCIYYDICLIAIHQNPLASCYALKEYLSDEEYRDVCLL